MRQYLRITHGAQRHPTATPGCCAGPRLDPHPVEPEAELEVQADDARRSAGGIRPGLPAPHPAPPRYLPGACSHIALGTAPTVLCAVYMHDVRCGAVCCTAIMRHPCVTVYCSQANACVRRGAHSLLGHLCRTCAAGGSCCTAVSTDAPIQDVSATDSLTTVVKHSRRRWTR